MSSPVRNPSSRMSFAVAVTVVTVALAACGCRSSTGIGEVASGVGVDLTASEVGTDTILVASTVVVGAVATEVTVPAVASLRTGAAPTPVTRTVTATVSGTATAAAGAASAAAPSTAPPAIAPPAIADLTPPTLPREAQVGLPPAGSEPRNRFGQPIRLDETAALACAHAQFALDAIQLGDRTLARGEVDDVVRWGLPSANTEISAAAATLASAFTDATARGPVDAFLAVCLANGHVI